MTTRIDRHGRPVHPPYIRPPATVTTPAVRVTVYTVAPVAAVIMNGLSDIVDGGTIMTGRGWWTDDADGSVDTETSVTMDMVTTPETVDTIGLVATMAARQHGESCIMMTVDPTSMAMIWTDGRTEDDDTETEDTVTVDPIPAVIRDMASIMDGAS